ncbi:Ig-like domain-containing protein, partial [Citrobacter sp. S2-9]
QNRATATVVDSQNNMLANTTVNWSVTGSAGLTSGTSTTNSSGQATITFTDTQAETVTLTAKAGGSDAGQSKTSSFVTDTATARVSTLTINTDGSVANGTAQNSATATVVDSQNNVLADTTVNWTVTGSAGLTSGTSTTNSSGQATITFTDTKAETVTLTAKAGGSDAGQSKTSSFVADTATARVSTLTIDPDGSPADGVTSNMATATVTDVNNNPVAGVTINWSRNKNTVMFSAISGVSDVNGKISVTFTDTVPESVNITASIPGVGGMTKTSTFVGPPKIVLVNSGGSPVADGVTSAGVTATVTSASGSPMSGVIVRWSVDSNTVKLSASSGVTDSSGQVMLTYTDTVAEHVTITATLDGGISKTAGMTFVADFRTATIASYTVDPDGSPADGVTDNGASVVIKDTFGNPVSGVGVSWSASFATLSSHSNSTDQNGRAAITFTSTTAGSKNILVTLFNGQTVTLPSYFVAVSP